MVVAGPGVVLKGPRVVLRRGTAEDAPALVDIRCEPEVRRWWLAPPPIDQVVRELLGEEDDVSFVIVVDGEVVGLVQYAEETDPDYRHASMDIFLSARVHGRGLGTEAVAVTAAYLIDVLGHHRITIDPALANASAIRAYAKAGFRPVGVMRRYERDEDGAWHDSLLMDLLADELIRDDADGSPGSGSTLRAVRSSVPPRVLDAPRPCPPHDERDPTVKPLNRPDESTTFMDGSVRVSANLGNAIVGYGVYKPGWRWSQHVGPLTGQSSQHHCGYVVSGRFGVRSHSGTEVEVGSGEAFAAGGGHDAWVIGDEPCVALDWWPIGD